MGAKRDFVDKSKIIKKTSKPNHINLAKAYIKFSEFRFYYYKRLMALNILEFAINLPTLCKEVFVAKFIAGSSIIWRAWGKPRQPA